jgi:uncharacterized protein (DUF3820 family)
VSTLPFGKHKGEDIEDVPTDYLLWFVGNIDPPKGTGNTAIDSDRREMHMNLMSEIEDELASREKHGYEKR